MDTESTAPKVDRPRLHTGRPPISWTHRILIYLFMISGVVLPWACGVAHLAGYCWAFILGLVTGVVFMFIATGTS